MERNKRNIWKTICLLCVLGAAACIAVACIGDIRQEGRAEDMSRLAQAGEEGGDPGMADGEGPLIGSGEEPGGVPEGPTPREAFEASVKSLAVAGIPIPEKEVDLPALQEGTNADIYAWIYIPGTKIDYPVLQHPTDDRYYLDHNIDGSKGYPGCIYSEGAYNKKDFTDANTVLYGHNMKNGSMFAGLHKYEDSEFFLENPYVYIYTEDRLLVYEIFGAYVHGNEHLLYSHDFSDPVVSRRYFEGVMEERTMNSNFREGVELSGGEHILTLSTCIANKPDNRYLVQGVLINED